MNRFAKMKKERIYTLFETLSFFRIKIILLKMNRFAKRKIDRIYTFGTLSTIDDDDSVSVRYVL